MMGMPSCREVARAVSGGEISTAPLPRRFGVRLHLLMCHRCRDYARQIRALGQAARDLFTESKEDEASLERLKRSLRARIGAPPGEG